MRYEDGVKPEVRGGYGEGREESELRTQRCELRKKSFRGKGNNLAHEIANFQIIEEEDK